jgi:hypothetical protein
VPEWGPQHAGASASGEPAGAGAAEARSGSPCVGAAGCRRLHVPVQLPFTVRGGHPCRLLVRLSRHSVRARPTPPNPASPSGCTTYTPHTPHTPHTPDAGTSGWISDRHLLPKWEGTTQFTVDEVQGWMTSVVRAPQTLGMLVYPPSTTPLGVTYCLCRRPNTRCDGARRVPSLCALPVLPRVSRQPLGVLTSAGRSGGADRAHVEGGAVRRRRVRRAL